MVGEHWNPITTPHSLTLAEMGGNQQQPGVEDGGTPIEVVADKSRKSLKKNRKQENPKKKKTRKCT